MKMLVVRNVFFTSFVYLYIFFLRISGLICLLLIISIVTVCLDKVSVYFFTFVLCCYLVLSRLKFTPVRKQCMINEEIQNIDMLNRCQGAI